jgi:MscS family membrane protein
VKAFLAGLGIGGLAVALAAQDTLANIFGSVVVAVDQPFKLGEFVQIGPNAGAVEDIGLRSTKLRRADKALVVVPNKVVASEPILNLSRFTRRRSEQVIGIAHGATGPQMDALVEEMRQLILAEKEEVVPESVMVFFRDVTQSSLEIWIVFESKDADFQKHMRLKQRLNVAFMKAVETRGLAFAFPRQAVHLEGGIARKLAQRGGGDEQAPQERQS